MQQILLCHVKIRHRTINVRVCTKVFQSVLYATQIGLDFDSARLTLLQFELKAGDYIWEAYKIPTLHVKQKCLGWIYIAYVINGAASVCMRPNSSNVGFVLRLPGDVACGMPIMFQNPITPC